MVYFMELSQREIIQKPKMQELSSLFMKHRLIVMYAPSQGEIIQKPKMQELSSLFMTHHLIVMYAPVKFHEYIL